MVVAMPQMAQFAVESAVERIPMTIQLSQLADLVGGRVIGNEDTVCQGANPLGVAEPNDITMIDDVSRAKKVTASAAIAVVTPKEIDGLDRPQIVAEDPHAAFTKIVAHFRPPVSASDIGTGIDPTAQISDSAVVHPSATIGAGCVIGARTTIMPGVIVYPNCKIGDDCTIHSGAVIYTYTVLENRVTVHSNCVLGAHGFGYREVNGKHAPTAQLGYVRVQDDVEMGACVTIDRGTYGATLIGEGTKIDNQVQIAHNCRIGRHNLLCSQVGIAGSCTTGDYVIMAGQVGLKDHINLADRVIIGAQSGVMNECVAGETYLGSPATPQREQMQIIAIERKLPEMRKEVKALRRELDKVKRQIFDEQINDESKAA